MASRAVKFMLPEFGEDLKRYLLLVASFMLQWSYHEILNDNIAPSIFRWLIDVENVWTAISTKVGGLGVTKHGHEMAMAGGGALWRGPGLYGFREETDSRHHFKTPTQVSI